MLKTMSKLTWLKIRAFGLVVLFVDLDMTVLMIDRETGATSARVHSIIIMVVPTLMCIILFRHSEIEQTWIDSRLRSPLIFKRGTYISL